MLFKNCYIVTLETQKWCMGTVICYLSRLGMMSLTRDNAEIDFFYLVMP